MHLLTRAKEAAEASGAVPEEVTRPLQKALDIASGLDVYLETMSTQQSEPLAELYKYVLPSCTCHSKMLRVGLDVLILSFTVSHCSKTVSHDWDQVHKEGKTKFRLPKECITGHVEGLSLTCSPPHGRYLPCFHLF